MLHVVTRHSRDFALLSVVAALWGCDLQLDALASDQDATKQCASNQDIYAICQLDHPNDLALLPDSPIILISEAGSEGGGGSISSYHTLTGERQTIYDRDSRHAFGARRAIWGSSDCDEPVEFNPISIDVGRRLGGRWQLLVANRREQEISIELIELIKTSVDEAGDVASDAEQQTAVTQNWQALWRGCVYFDGLDAAPSTLAHTDGAKLAGDQIVLSAALIGAESTVVISIRESDSRNSLWRWRLRDGWQKFYAADSDRYAWSVAYAPDQKRYIISTESSKSFANRVDASTRSQHQGKENIAYYPRAVGHIDWVGADKRRLVTSASDINRLLRGLCDKVAMMRSYCNSRVAFYDFDVDSQRERQLYPFAKNADDGLLKTFNLINISNIVRIDGRYYISLKNDNRIIVVANDLGKSEA